MATEMRRFYRHVGIAVCDGGFEVRLDGRPLRTPAKTPMVLPTRALASAVAEEWDAQGQTVRAAQMHLTQLAATAIDRVAANRALVVDTVSAYAETDLLCHRAAQPRALAERQLAVWQPILDWAILTFDAPLAVTTDIMPMRQPERALTAIRGAVAAMDDMALTALNTATALLGSVVLALALDRGHIDAIQACAAAHLDDDFQAERWGSDRDAEARRTAIEAELTSLEGFLRHLRT